MKTQKLMVMLAVCIFSATGVYAQRVEAALVDGHPVINCDQMPAAAITSTSKGNTVAEWKTAAANETVFHRFAVYKSEDEIHITLSTAIAECLKLGTGWRLPTQRELMLLYVLSDELDKTAGFTPFFGAIYWSATENSPDTNWRVMLNSGMTYFDPNTVDETHFARCIKEL